LSVPGGGGTGARIAKAFKGPKLANYAPDYQSIINQDPAFMALKQSLSAQGIANASQRRAATNQDLIQFGSIPDFAHVAQQLGLSPDALKMLQGDIDPATAGLAAGNQFSTEHELKRQEDQAMLGLRNNLAARGGLSSGEDAYQSGNQEHNYEKAQQDALVSLLSHITGLQQSYTTSQQGQQQQLVQAIQQAESTNAGLPQYQGFSLHYNARSGKYVGPSGEKYTPIRQGKGWLLRDDGTGLSYALNADGSLTLKS
jgi:hypothetical protein